MLLRVNGTIRLVKDPEIRYMNDGKGVVNFTGVSSEKYNQKEKSCFIDFTVFGGLGDKVVMKYLSKGSQIYVTGKLIQDTWEKDGQKRSKHSVIVEDLEMLGKAETKQEQQHYQLQERSEHSQHIPTPEIIIEDSELPF